MSPWKVRSASWLNRYCICLGVLWAVAALLMSPLRAAAEDPIQPVEDPVVLFQQANADYQQGEFSKAVLGYRQLLDSGYVSGPLYYNLGNAHFQLGQKGWAVLYYYKALRFIPGDADLHANLQSALADLELATPGWWAQSWPKLIYWASLNDWTMLTSVGFFLLMVGICSRVLLGQLSTGKSFNGWARWGLGLWRTTGILMLFTLAMAITSGWDQSSRQAVITQSAVNAGFEPHRSAAVSLELKEGFRIYVLEQDGEWSLIRQPGGKQGWVPRDSYQTI